MSLQRGCGWELENPLANLQKLVGTARFELATPCTPSKCATRLRYVPMEPLRKGSVGFD